MEWSLLGEDHRLLLLFHVVQGGVGDPKHKRIPISSSVWHVLQKMMGGRGAGQGVVLAGDDYIRDGRGRCGCEESGRRKERKPGRWQVDHQSLLKEKTIKISFKVLLSRISKLSLVCPPPSPGW